MVMAFGQPVHAPQIGVHRIAYRHIGRVVDIGAGRECPVCRKPYTAVGPRSRTRDHIIPQARGGMDWAYGDSRNLRPACRRCNTLRAQAAHCVGLAVCALAVAGNTQRAPNEVLRGWMRRATVRIGSMVHAVQVLACVGVGAP